MARYARLCGRDRYPYLEYYLEHSTIFLISHLVEKNDS